MQRRVRARNQNRHRPLKPPAPQKSCRRFSRRQLFLGSEGKVAERFGAAPARGATRPAGGYSPPRRDFNPRTHAGYDMTLNAVQHIFVISIHTPARGATKVIKTIYDPLAEFQPTPPHRVRQQTCIKANTCLPFYYIFCTDPCQSSRNFFCRPSSFSIFSYVVGADLPGNPCALAIRTALNADPFSLFSPKGYCLQGLALAGEVQRRKWPSVWGDKKPPRRCPARQGGHKFYLTSVTSKWG